MDARLPVVLNCCCGIDVHKKTLTACLLTTGASGQAAKQIRVFRAVTGQLHELSRWLVQQGCRQVAIASTGVYWRPAFNVLEQARIEVVLVNAAHVRNVPGRKTDVQDAEWLATLLRVGLLRGSFVPPQEVRELRDLTRYRTPVIRQRADACDRIQKLLENGTIKLASVASNVLGASGRDMLRALGDGVDSPEVLADMARGRLRDKIPESVEALRGVMTDTRRWLLREQLHKVAELDEAIGRLDAKAAELCLPFAQALAVLDQIPGVNQRIAQVIVAEVGLDMSRFRSAAQLASWSGRCPGNRESAGKQTSGRTRRGHVWLRQALVEAAWAASHTKETSLRATFGRVKGRRGGKRACLAVGHRILRMAHALLSRPRPYQEEGPDDYRAPDKDRVKDRLVRRLQQLGYAVTVTDTAPVA
jgi:transposase